MRILISGGGIAGLTLAFWLEKFGFEPIVIEKADGLRKEGYMIDFFGSGWDVAERMEVVEKLRSIKYPIENMAFVGRKGKPYFKLDIEKFREACEGRYVSCLRSDLEKILWEAVKEKVEIRFLSSVKMVHLGSEPLEVTFENDHREGFDLAVGADGVHSNIRSRVFGPEDLFARNLGLCVASFRAPNRRGLRNDLLIYHEPGRQAGFYPLSGSEIATAYLFKSSETGWVCPEDRAKKLKEVFSGAGWILEDVLRDIPEDEPILNYESFLRPFIEAKQKQAAYFSRSFIPDDRFRIWMRRVFTRIAMSRFFVRRAMKAFGSESILPKAA